MMWDDDAMSEAELEASRRAAYRAPLRSTIRWRCGECGRTGEAATVRDAYEASRACKHGGQRGEVAP